MLEIEAADGGALRCQFAETTVEVAGMTRAQLATAVQDMYNAVVFACAEAGLGCVHMATYHRGLGSSVTSLRAGVHAAVLWQRLRTLNRGSAYLDAIEDTVCGMLLACGRTRRFASPMAPFFESRLFVAAFLLNMFPAKNGMAAYWHHAAAPEQFVDDMCYLLEVTFCPHFRARVPLDTMTAIAAGFRNGCTRVHDMTHATTLNAALGLVIERLDSSLYPDALVPAVMDDKSREARDDAEDTRYALFQRLTQQVNANRQRLGLVADAGPPDARPHKSQPRLTDFELEEALREHGHIPLPGNARLGLCASYLHFYDDVLEHLKPLHPGMHRPADARYIQKLRALCLALPYMVHWRLMDLLHRVLQRYQRVLFGLRCPLMSQTQIDVMIMQAMTAADVDMALGIVLRHAAQATPAVFGTDRDDDDPLTEPPPIIWPRPRPEGFSADFDGTLYRRTVDDDDDDDDEDAAFFHGTFPEGVTLADVCDWSDESDDDDAQYRADLEITCGTHDDDDDDDDYESGDGTPAPFTMFAMSPSCSRLSNDTDDEGNTPKRRHVSPGPD